MNVRRSDLGKKQILLCCLVLQFSIGVWGQNCNVASTCSFFNIPRHTIIGVPDPSMTQDVSLRCSGNFLYNSVSSIRWLATTDLSTPQPLNVVADPKLTATNFNLELRNVTGNYEAIYYCQAEYTNGELSDPQGIGCVFVAGRAFYKTCPMTAMGVESCETATDLQAEVGRSVEFDTRIEFRNGGSCGERQNVRLMFLNKVMETGEIETQFICSNLGSFGNNPICDNRSRVSVSFQGTSKYDIKLSLNGLTEADAGRYQVRVDLDDIVGGKRISIYKNFLVTLPDKPTPSTVPVVPDEDLECSKVGSGPLLLLNGEVLSANSTVMAEEIMEGAQALICVTANEECCDGNGGLTAQFLSPSNTPVTEALRNGLYISKGKQTVKLNRSGPVTEQGTYCCSIGDKETKCINIEL